MLYDYDNSIAAGVGSDKMKKKDFNMMWRLSSLLAESLFANFLFPDDIIFKKPHHGVEWKFLSERGAGKRTTTARTKKRHPELI